MRQGAEVFVDSTFSVCIPALIEGAEWDARFRRFHHTYSADRRQSLIESSPRESALASELVETVLGPSHHSPARTERSLAVTDVS